jgi:hypothetical protein
MTGKALLSYVTTAHLMYKCMPRVFFTQLHELEAFLLVVLIMRSLTKRLALSIVYIFTFN